MKYTIFEIDNSRNAAVLNRFKNHMAAIKRSGAMQNNIVDAYGVWKGETNYSFIMRRDDFDRFVRFSGFVDEQEAFMHVSECNKQYASLEWRDGHIEPMGSLMSVSREVAEQAPGYTYRPDLNVYWVAVNGNPDHIDGRAIPPFAESIHHLVDAPILEAAE